MMRKLNVLLAFALLSALPLMAAQEPLAPAAGPIEHILAMAAPAENGACAVDSVGKQDSASLAIFLPDAINKSCGTINAPCARPAGAGPCTFNCPCPTYTSCTLVNARGCTLCVSP